MNEGSDTQAAVRSSLDVNAVPETIPALIARLAGKSERDRIAARQALVDIGQPSVIPLIQALSSKSETVRFEVSKALDRINLPWYDYATPPIIAMLISDLANKDGTVRVTARRLLVAIGPKAVDELISTTRNKDQQIRWESLKALAQIGDSGAVQALIEALSDSNFDIRWIAAEGLIAIGQPALVPLLRALKSHADSLALLEGAHHILHDIKKDGCQFVLRPVLEALEDSEPSLEVPFAANKAIAWLEKWPKIC